MQGKKSVLTGLKKVMGWLLVILALFFIVLAAWNFWLKDKIPINITVHKNETIQQTVLPQGQTVWNSVTRGITIIPLTILGFFICLWIYKILMARRVITSKAKEQCIKAAREQLIKAGYDIAEDAEPVYTFDYFGVDSDKFPRWAFMFRKIGIPSRTYYYPFELVSCIISAKTMAISNEEEGRSRDIFFQQLHDQRYGKWAVPNDPGKTEKEPGLFGYIPEGSTVNVPISEPEAEE